MRIVNLIISSAVIMSAHAAVGPFKKDEKIKLSSEKNDRDADTAKPREKRQLPLVYPYGGTYKLLVGMALPIPSDDHISLLFAANFQYQYLQVQNITSVSQYYSYLTVSRGERALDDVENRANERYMFYAAMEEMLSSKGFNGRECVLRAICEAAQYPVEEEGLVGEILHILLTPNYGKSEVATWRGEAAAREPEPAAWDYESARAAGAQMFSCPALFSGCPEGEGVMEIISILRDD